MSRPPVIPSRIESAPTRNHLLAVVLAVGFGAAGFADTVFLRDGSRREGKVQWCDEEGCSVDGKRIDLSRISRIELGKATRPWSVPAKSVLRKDGTIVEGSFTGLNLGYVFVGDEEIDRDRVGVIFIEAPPDTTLEAGTAGGVESGTAAQPEPPPAASASQSDPSPIVQPTQPSSNTPGAAPPSPSPAPAAAPRAPPAPPPGRSRSTTAKTWNGRVRGLAWGNVDGCRSRLNLDAMVRLVEDDVRPLRAMDGTIIGTVTMLGPSGSTIRNRYRSVCTGGTAAGSGTTTVQRDDVQEGSPGAIYRNTKTTPRRTANGIDLQPGEEWYSLTIAPADADEFDVIYRSGPNSNSSPADFMYPVIGGAPLLPTMPLGDPEARYVQGGRMSGSFTTSATGLFEKYSLSWSICREGVPCPPPSLPEAAQQERCPEEARAELCNDQLMSYLEEWEEYQQEYARLTKEADKYYDDYVTALRRCAAWRVVQTILETILGAQTAKLGQAGENAENALKLFKALIEGDPSAPFGEAVMGDAEAAFKPLEIANKVKGWVEQGNSIGELLSKAGSLNDLRGAAVDSCLGFVNPEIHMNAQKFIENTRKAGEYYKNTFAPQMNDIDAKMRECAHREEAAERACQ